MVKLSSARADSLLFNSTESKNNFIIPHILSYDLPFAITVSFEATTGKLLKDLVIADADAESAKCGVYSIKHLMLIFTLNALNGIL